MLGRWIQNRTGDFGETVSDDENSPIALEGVVTKKKNGLRFRLGAQAASRHGAV